MYRVLIRGLFLLVGLAALAFWLDSMQFFDRQARNPALVADNIQKQAKPPNRNAGAAVILEKQDDGHFYVDAWINDDPVRMMVDTGASTVVLSRETAEYLGFDFWDEEFDLTVKTAGGGVRGVGIILDEIMIGDTVSATSVPAIVLMEGDIDLLGMSFLSKISGFSLEGDELILRP